MNFTIAEHLKMMRGANPSVHNNAKNGVAIDSMGLENLTWLIAVGTITDGVLDAKLQEATDAAFTTPVDIAGAAITQLALTDDDIVCAISLIRGAWSLRYLRIVLTGSASTGSATSAVVLAWGGGAMPPAQLAELQESVIVT